MVPSERPSRARYRSLLSAQETEKAIKMIKDFSRTTWRASFI